MKIFFMASKRCENSTAVLTKYINFKDEIIYFYPACL